MNKIRKKYWLTDTIALFHKKVTCRIFGHDITLYGAQNPEDPCDFYNIMPTGEKLYNRILESDRQRNDKAQTEVVWLCYNEEVERLKQQILEDNKLRKIIQIEITKAKIEEDRLRKILQECREDNDEYGAVGYSNQVSQQMIIGEKLQSILKESQS